MSGGGQMSDGPITDYGQLIERLANTDDPAERRRYARQLAHRLEGAFGQTVDTAQVVRWETEEWLRQRVGETNDLMSQLIADQRAARTEAAGEVKAGFDDLQQALAAFRASQETALTGARAEFHDGFNRVGESLSQMRAELAEVSSDVAVLKEAGINQEQINHSLLAGQDRLDTAVQANSAMLATYNDRITALEVYAAGMPEDERKRIIALAETNEQRYQEIQAQLTELLNRPSSVDARRAAD